MRWLVALKIAGLILLFDPAALQSFELPKAIFSHALAWPLAGLAGLAFWRFGATIVPRSRLHLAVGAVAGVWVVSAVFAADHFLAFYGDPSRYEGLAYLADMLVLYIAVAVAFREASDYWMPTITLTVASGLAILYAAAQRLAIDPVNWNLDSTARPFGPFGNPDIFGHFLSIAFAVTFGLALFADGPHRWSVRLPAIALGLVVLATAAIVATRGTVVGVAATVLVTPFVVLRVRGVSGRAIGGVVGGTTLLVVAVAMILALSPLGDRVRSTLAGVGLRDRIVIYEAALAATRDRPLFGWGPDNFAVAFPLYRNPDPEAGHPGNEPGSSAHSWLLHAAATTGITGAVALIALIVATTRLVLRVGAQRSPLVVAPLFLGLVAYWSHGLVSVGSVSVDWYGWAALGGVVGMSSDRVPAPQIRLTGRWATAALAAGAAILAGFGWQALDASHQAAAANGAIRSGLAERAISAALAATKSDPGRFQYWEVLGLAYDLRQRWRDSGDAFAEAARRAPYVATNLANLARSRGRQALAGDQASGGSAAALSAAQRAVAVDPKNWEVQSVLAEVENAFGESEESLATIAVAVRLNPNNPNNDVVADQAASKMTDAARARFLLERILEAKESASLRVSLAAVALRLNDRAAALSNARRALELDPTNVDAQRIITNVGG